MDSFRFIIVPWLLVLQVAGALKPPDYSVLSRRIAKAHVAESAVYCVLLDTLLPRQRVNMHFAPPVSRALCDARDTGKPVVALGMNHRQGSVLRRGVEVNIESMSPYLASHGFFSSHSTTPMRGFTAFETTLVGGRRFELVDDPSRTWPPDEPVFTTTVRWLPSPSEEECPPKAIAIAEELQPMIDEWIGLVRSGKREREPQQLEKLLADLGPMPGTEDALYRAFWTAALINPVPALGVALEVRPMVLESNDALHTCEIVKYVLSDSIRRLKSMPPGPFEAEPPPRRRS